MESTLLPDELMLMLQQQWPCRESQIRQLSVLLSPTSTPPPIVIVHGPGSTGKSGLIRAFLEASNIRHAIAQCRECVTGRHMLERAVTAIYDCVTYSGNINGTKAVFDARCENLSGFTAHLQRLLGHRTDNTLLVLDGVDQQKDAAPTLLPALGRLTEYVRGLTVLIIVRYPGPRYMHRAGIPHVEFPAYTRAQSVHILAQHPPAIFLEPPRPELQYDDEVHEEDKAWLWPRFCAAVWDSFGQQVARDLVSFRSVCVKLWRPFVEPVVAGDFGTRDFSRLVVAQRRLFQDESTLTHSLIAKPTMLPNASTEQAAARKRTRDLPYHSKWLLIAAYLASFCPPRMDANFFMKASDRSRRKKGGGSRAAPGRPSQQRKIARHLLSPSAFPLDRLLSILHAILPDDIKFGLDIYTQIATLASLRLLIRSSGLGSGDPLEPGGKWRVGPAVSWEYAQALSRSVDFNLVDYIVE